MGIRTLKSKENFRTHFWGLLHNKLRFETYPPVGTFPRGWYVYRVNGVDGPEEMERN